MENYFLRYAVIIFIIIQKFGKYFIPLLRGVSPIVTNMFPYKKNFNTPPNPLLIEGGFTLFIKVGSWFYSPSKKRGLGGVSFISLLSLSLLYDLPGDRQELNCRR